VAGIAAAVLPSVVSIQTTSSNGEGTGSGFVIRKDGYLLTNNHVVASAADGGEIKVAYQDGRTSPATIVGRDPYSDLAVLKVPRTDLKPVTLGDSSSVAVGDPVVAVGSPLGLAGTVTSGIVSALDRPVQAGGSQSGNGSEANTTYTSAIQTDAAVNPGNSGGPLLDGEARVIGINSAIATLSGGGTGQAGSIGLGFAIPVNQAQRVAKQLIATGKATRTVIGASIDQGYSGAVDGVKLSEVPAGPAQKAGLRAGDIITRFGTKVVDDPVALIADIRAQSPGTQVKLTYVRDGRTATTTVTLGSTTN
jgi:putative serine protease PepD